jgi:hypothetical protein
MQTSLPRRAPIVLQARDHALIDALYRHRYLSTSHIHELLFATRSRRVVQERLAKLTAARYLSRQIITRSETRLKRVHPLRDVLYSLARAGAELLARKEEVALAAIPHTRAQNALGFDTMLHHLVVTDILVALECAARDTAGTLTVTTMREHTLRRVLGLAAAGTRVPRPWLLPDGACTLTLTGKPFCLTYYLEVVRSLPPGGRAAVKRKFEHYLRALAHGHLPRIFGHEHVGAVLIVAPTYERAEHLRRVAEELPKHRARFWFAPYLPPDPAPYASAICPNTVLTPMWRDGLGNSHSLVSLFDHV